MRVLVISQHFAPEDNAPAYRWGWLTARLAAAGWDVDVICATWQHDLPRSQRHGAVTIQRVTNALPGRNLARRMLNELQVMTRSAWAALRVPRPDVVVVTCPPIGAMVMAHLISHLRRRPLVLDLRDAWPELLDDWRTWSDEGLGPRRQPFRSAVLAMAVPPLKKVLARVRRRAALVVTTSSRLADQLPHAVMVRNSSRPAAKLDPRPWDGCLHVLYAGTVGRAQLLTTAVRAAALVQRRGGHMVLRIIGSGAHLEAVRSLARQLDAPVQFLPRTSHDTLEEHYIWADSLLVILRDWLPLEKTVPSKLYEALARGRHVSASLAGEAAAIVAATGAGTVTPPQDAEALAENWLGLINDPSQLHIGDTGTAWVKTNCDPDQLAHIYDEALSQVAAR